MDPKIHDYYAGTAFGSNPKISGPTRNRSFCLDLLRKEFSGPPENDVFAEAFAKMYKTE